MICLEHESFTPMLDLDTSIRGVHKVCTTHGPCCVINDSHKQARIFAQ